MLAQGDRLKVVGVGGFHKGHWPESVGQASHVEVAGQQLCVCCPTPVG